MLKTLIYQGFLHTWVKNSSSKNHTFSLRGNKSIKAVFDSQVVRFDVNASRVYKIDVFWIWQGCVDGFDV